MRAFALLLVMSCRIPDERFSLRDGPHDAPTAPLTKVYVASDSGIQYLPKDMNGDLNAAQPVATGKFVSLGVGVDGTQLYALFSDATANLHIHHFVILSNDTLLEQSDQQDLDGAERLAVDPRGRIIAIASGQTRLTTVPLDASGQMGSPISHVVIDTAIVHDVAFTAGGDCLLVLTDDNLDPRLYGYPVNDLQSPTSSVGVVAGAHVIAMHPGLPLAYVAGPATSAFKVTPYSIASDCSVVRGGLDSGSFADTIAGLVVSPNRQFVFATAKQVYALQIDGTGELTGTSKPSLPEASGVIGAVAAVDPFVQDRIYVTGPGYLDTTMTMAGAIAAQIQSDGTVTSQSSQYFLQPPDVPHAIVLAP
jgi:hypothetical protein